eukprot:1203808-Amphidinium_carterae.1
MGTEFTFRAVLSDRSSYISEDDVLDMPWPVKASCAAGVAPSGFNIGFPCNSVACNNDHVNTQLLRWYELCSHCRRSLILYQYSQYFVVVFKPFGTKREGNQTFIFLLARSYYSSTPIQRSLGTTLLRNCVKLSKVRPRAISKQRQDCLETKPI